MLVLAGAVHVARRNLFDVVTFAVVAAMVVAAPSLDRRPRARPGWLGRWSVPVGAAVLLALLVGLRPRTSAAVEAAYLAVGGCAFAVALRAGRGAPPQAARAPRTWPWTVVVLAGCLLELGGFLSQPDAQTGNPDHPTLSSLVDPLLATGWLRGVVAGAWLLAGWWVVRVVADRGDAHDDPA